MGNTAPAGNIDLNRADDDEEIESLAQFLHGIDWETKSEDLPEPDLTGISIPEPTPYRPSWHHGVVNENLQLQETPSKSDQVVIDGLHPASVSHHPQIRLNPPPEALVAEKAAIRNSDTKAEQDNVVQAQAQAHRRRSNRNHLAVPTQLFSPSTTNRVFIRKRDMSDNDILCGREYVKTEHPGNKIYLDTIADHKVRHQELGSQHGDKTNIRNDIVKELLSRGCRFVKKDGDSFYLLTLQEARVKVGQSLREKPKKK